MTRADGCIPTKSVDGRSAAGNAAIGRCGKYGDSRPIAAFSKGSFGTKRFHAGGIPLRMPHQPHALSKLLDECGIGCRIREMWHDVTERRQDEPVSRRRKNRFGEIFDSEVLLQPRV